MENIKGSAIGGSFEVFGPSELLAFHRSNFLVVSALATEPFVVSARLEEFFRDLLVSCYLFIEGIIKSSWMEFLATARNVPGSLVLAFWYYCLMMKKVS